MGFLPACSERASSPRGSLCSLEHGRFLPSPVPDDTPDPSAAPPEPLPSRRLALAWLIALGACLVASVAVARWHPLPRGFQLRSPPSSNLMIVTPEIDLEPLARLPAPFSAHWRGI